MGSDYEWVVFECGEEENILEMMVVMVVHQGECT